MPDIQLALGSMRSVRQVREILRRDKLSVNINIR